MWYLRQTTDSTVDMMHGTNAEAPMVPSVVALLVRGRNSSSRVQRSSKAAASRHRGADRRLEKARRTCEQLL